ncbi:MAG: delta-class carbonic anhydrase [Hyphomicrobiales bacterium]
MTNRISTLIAPATAALLFTSLSVGASLAAGSVDDGYVAKQRNTLAESTKGKGYGPQSPRDLGTLTGNNSRAFGSAPAHTAMNLCNIHFHENAEHKGGSFTAYAGNGNGKGAGTGFQYTGKLSDTELKPYGKKVGEGKYGDLQPGDTIEVHYVHTTAKVSPGPTLGSCLSEAIGNPQLRVETQVYVIVNDVNAANFVDLAKVEKINDLYQAPNIPTDTGAPIQYTGSTTGPSYNEKGSPFQVSWSVRPEIKKITIQSVDAWLGGNIFEEDHAHGVRNLVTNPDLISNILN